MNNNNFVIKRHNIQTFRNNFFFVPEQRITTLHQVKTREQKCAKEYTLKINELIQSSQAKGFFFNAKKIPVFELNNRFIFNGT